MSPAPASEGERCCCSYAAPEACPGCRKHGDGTCEGKEPAPSPSSAGTPADSDVAAVNIAGERDHALREPEAAGTTEALRAACVRIAKMPHWPKVVDLRADTMVCHDDCPPCIARSALAAPPEPASAQGRVEPVGYAVERTRDGLRFGTLYPTLAEAERMATPDGYYRVVPLYALPSPGAARATPEETAKGIESPRKSFDTSEGRGERERAEAAYAEWARTRPPTGDSIVPREHFVRGYMAALAARAGGG